MADTPVFKIHPAIGVARVGDSERGFYLSPDRPGRLPIAADADGLAVVEGGAEQRVRSFRDAEGRLMRQAARFRVHAYDAAHPEGREIRVGDTFRFSISNPGTGEEVVEGTVTDVAWTAHLANKKASWYRFLQTQGRHGYAPDHPLRNPDADTPDARRALIIDPGEQSVWLRKTAREKARPRAEFARGANPGSPQQFPPESLRPAPIDTLGELRATAQDGHPRLLVLGGYGRAGSTASAPRLTGYANNDGWFDDVSDGPVRAAIRFEWHEEVTQDDGTTKRQTHQGSAEVDVPAWAVVGYPRYAPQIVDMITMDETLFDLFVRRSAFRPALFGVEPGGRLTNAPETDEEWALWRQSAGFRAGYVPRFYEEIWPILRRPDVFGWTLVYDTWTGSDPHNRGTGGNFDVRRLAQPPRDGADPYRQQRQYLYEVLRKPGGQNRREAATDYAPHGYTPRAMPELCGNNPLSNVAPDKFLRLTDVQLFLLKQWAEGRFVNECDEWDRGDARCADPHVGPPSWGDDAPLTGEALDRGALGNVVGGPFCPGAELTWSVLNPAIFESPYRVRHAPYVPGALSLPAVAFGTDRAEGEPDASDLTRGLEPGDLTKHLALPWQADFTQCTYQDIDVTYEDWNALYLDTTGDPAERTVAYNVPWWPGHRPMVVVDAETGGQVYWNSGIPNNDAGMLRMVTGWPALGFVLYDADNENGPGYYQVERDDARLGPPVTPGDLYRGTTKTAEQ